MALWNPRVCPGAFRIDMILSRDGPRPFVGSFRERCGFRELSPGLKQSGIVTGLLFHIVGFYLVKSHENAKEHPMGLIAILGVGTGLAATPSAPPIHYERFAIGKAVYHTVQASLASGGFSLETVHSRRLTSVWNLVAAPRPIAAVTGTFFSPRSQSPVADVIVDGTQVSAGSIGSALGVSWYGDVSIFDRPFHTPVDWGAFRYGLRGAVRVVENGKVQPNPKAQRFRDRRIWGKAARAGLGLTTDGRLVLVATKSHVSLSEFGKAMKSRGVTEGISLDGGSSTCLYYKGALVVPPGRKLSNLVVIRESVSSVAVGAVAPSVPSLFAPETPFPVAAKPAARPLKP